MFKKKKKATRYFHFSVETPTHEISGYAEGTDTLLGIIEECTNTLGYGIEISVSEISKEEYEKIKENEDDEGGAYDRL